LSVAGIFRPFRSLPPYVQFAGRIMRVIVQNDARHPDNYGFIVTHIGLNLDRHLEGFRDMDREDKEFFANLISGAEPEPPEEVLAGRTRLKLRPEMVVHNEIVSELFKEDLLDSDDEALMAELRDHADALGFDGDAIVRAAKESKSQKPRSERPPEPFPINPQKQRQEARKRLVEEAQRTAKLLLNRLGLEYGEHDLAFKICPGSVKGPNFVAAVQMVNRELDRFLGIKNKERSLLKTEDFVRGRDGLEDILNSLTRTIKKRMQKNGQEGQDTVVDR
jgi:DNA repair protein RadD